MNRILESKLNSANALLNSASHFYGRSRKLSVSLLRSFDRSCLNSANLVNVSST
ncbi:hypothetical protein [Leptospira noguchii]|uniref:hypothetical protein n=1 Tax=Leptospira noguchii TaxID=28182 RepID=UPI001FB6EA2C|nr:hypothetical protein [Leptospira noguchii]UOG30957.1 hypothetical protein MAL06_02425 [Leptospira noguchii]